MAEARYPVFAAGQTLTKDDLNRLRDFLDGKDRLVARLIGFGIDCGLSGKVVGSDLRIAPGLAIDQAGNGLLLDTPFTVAAGTAARDETFDFIDPAPGGVTPVLVITDTVEEASQCEKNGCEGHASTGVRRAEVVLVAGRLIVGAVDFSTELLLKEIPLTITLGGSVQGDFIHLRDAILDRLVAVGVVLPPEVMSRLSGLQIPDTVLPAIRMYRAAFLNQVFFAALDLLRCRSLHAATCLRDATRPGVALGWLHVTAGSPVWDCRYRHDFEPSEGLVTALFGGGCDDPCELLRNRFEALVRSYAEPAVPAPADPPSTPPAWGDFHICRKTNKVVASRNLYRGIPTDCFDWVHPPERLPPGWKDIYVQESPYRKPFEPPVPPQPDVLYAIDPVDFAEAGVISLLPAVGALAEGTRAVLKDVISGQHVTPDVRVLTLAEAAALPGFAPQSSVSLGDTIVLVRDNQNKIVATGRVTNQQVLKSTGADVAGAREAAGTALGAAREARTVATAADARVGEFATQITGVSADVMELGGKVTGFLAEVGGLHGRINAFGTSVAAVNARIDGIAVRADELSGVVSRTADEVRGRMDTFAERITLAESMTGRLGRDMEGALNTASRVDGRIDELYKIRLSGKEQGLAPERDVNAGLVDFFGVMRRSVESVATTRRRPAVREELARGTRR